MTEGYLRGWLTFDNKTSLSKFREEYILSYLERSIFSDTYKSRVALLSSLASGAINQQSIGLATKAYEDYIGLTLPYLIEKSTIKNKPVGVDLAKPEVWKAILDKKRKELNDQ